MDWKEIVMPAEGQESLYDLAYKAWVDYYYHVERFDRSLPHTINERGLALVHIESRGTSMEYASAKKRFLDEILRPIPREVANKTKYSAGRLSFSGLEDEFMKHQRTTFHLFQRTTMESIFSVFDIPENILFPLLKPSPPKPLQERKLDVGDSPSVKLMIKAWKADAAVDMSVVPPDLIEQVRNDLLLLEQRAYEEVEREALEKIKETARSDSDDIFFCIEDWKRKRRNR